MAVGETVDLGEALAEQLALALDPYPRAPTADTRIKEIGILSEEEAGPFGALAALKDQDWLREVQARTVRARERLSAIGIANGLRPLPSATNFVTIDCGRDGTHARAVLQALITQGIFVRMPGVAPLDRCIRVSCGDAAALAAFAEALPAALAEARG